jgi:predicted secreted Zn-dependent protease
MENQQFVRKSSGSHQNHGASSIMSRSMRIAVLTVAAVVAAACAKSAGRTSPIPAGSHQHSDSLEYYDVEGTTSAEVHRSMISRAPRSQSVGWAVGLMRYSFSHRESYAMSGSVCRPDIAFRTRSLIILPRWRFINQANAATQRAWNSFSLAVRTHEDTHRAIFLERVDSMYVAVKAVTAPDCDTARRLVAATLAMQRTRMDSEQRALDNTARMAPYRWPP